MEPTTAQIEAKAPKTAETSVQSGPPPLGVNGTAAPAEATPKSARAPKHPARVVLENLADLRITVALFALSLVLVFWGTLVQTDMGVWTVVKTYFRSLLVWVPLKVVFFNQVNETVLKIPFPGGWLIGGAMMINLLAAHAIRFKLAWNRAGILLIHAGIIIMMLGELVTGLYAVENQMWIREGQTVSTVIDIRVSELAIIQVDPNDPKVDHLVTVPAHLLKTGAIVDDPKVPFKVEVVKFMVNSSLHDEDGELKADRGFGKTTPIKERPEVSGVEGQKIDVPSAIVKLSDRQGKSLGTWLVSTNFVDPQWQWLEADGKKYKIALRFKQTTRPFTMHLTKFDFKVFEGTATPKDYRSHIHLEDKEKDVDRNVQIYMNAPLYYRGETFYQAGMDQDKRTGLITTTLSVVRNPGWVLPYISCAVVGIGLLIHFGLTLFRFLEKEDCAMNTTTLQKYLPYIAAALTLLYFGNFVRPQRSPANDFNYHDFSRIPAIGDGRYKPLDTVARSALTVITHRQTYYDAKEKKSYPAVKWLLDVQTSPSLAQGLFTNGVGTRQEVFRVENDELQRFLKVKPREGMRYSFDEITGNDRGDRAQFAALLKEMQRVGKMDPKKHTLFDGKVYELSQHLELFYRLGTHQIPLIIPGDKDVDKWITLGDALEKFEIEPVPDGPAGDAYDTYLTLLTAYDKGDVDGFNSTLASYIKRLEAQGKLTKTNTEVFFNEFAPFFWCWWAYVLAALLAGLSWLDTSWSQPMRKAGFAMIAVTSVIHLSGMILRMYLQDRMFVFVTNLYSSAVFIGLGCVCVSMIAEWFYCNGISIVVGSVTGFCTLIIAHLLSLDGDTMIMMQAVLDTNFWLATHVTTVTLGYTMAFVAGFMGVAYILLGMFTDKLRHGVANDLSRTTYGVLCGGMFLSFVGTVLGGLWADYSWGRFWGWDPKENGALLIVIWVALILHARWGGMVKQRGIAVLSVLGIIITAWSWFGTNFLGVGLHAYGGAKGAQMLGMVMIDFGFLAIAGLGMLPLEMWQSFRPLGPVTPPPGGITPPSTGITKAKPKLA